MKAQGRALAEFAFFAGLTALSVSLYIQALKIPNPGFDVLGPGFAPKYLALLVGVISSFIAGNVFFRKIIVQRNPAKESSEAAPGNRGNFIRFLSCAVLTVVYVVCIGNEVASFWILSATYIFLIQACLFEFSVKNVALAALVTVVAVGATYLAAISIFERAI